MAGGRFVPETSNRGDWPRLVANAVNALTRQIEVVGRKVTGAATLTSSDRTILADASGGAFSVFLPKATEVPNRVFTIKKIDGSGNGVTVEPDGAETIDGAANRVISTQWVSLTIQAIDGAWYIL